MPIKDWARHLRDGVVARERLRRANPGAVISSQVTFAGDPSKVALGRDVFVSGPTALFITDGGGLRESSLTVGERSYIGEFNNIRSAGTPIVIGADCLISQHVTIVGSNHGIRAGSLIVDQPWDGSGVVIGDGVWIGAGAVILPGAVLGDGVVVAAHSVVRGVIPPGSIIAGAPAREVSTRS